jgi:nucleoside-diphosphate kinase
LDAVSDALVIFKPDSAHRLAARAGLWSWLSSEREWKLEGLTWHKPATTLIENHYDFLRGRPFFPWLVDFMSTLPVIVGRLTADPSALERMRYELGETRIEEARPGSLRERYGIGGGVNILHLSDSPESGVKEVALWAGQVDLDRVDATLETTTDRPDHTYHLRSLASQYANGVHTDLAAQEIQRLLAEESDLTGSDFASLTRIILGAFTS